MPLPSAHTGPRSAPLAALCVVAGLLAAGCVAPCDVVIAGEEVDFCAEGGALIEPEPEPQEPLDADQDALTFAQERELGTDPNAADSDADGLEDAEELNLGTDPRDPDSDDDGLADGDEESGSWESSTCAGPLDPLAADTDQDGLTDGEELVRGTCPSLADTDGDGDDDGDELDCGSSPLDPFFSCP